MSTLNNQPLAAQPQYRTNPALHASPFEGVLCPTAQKILGAGSPTRAAEPACTDADLEKPPLPRESDIPGSSAYKLAATLDSLFARNPWQWTCRMTIRLNPSVKSLAEARKNVRYILTDYFRCWFHGSLWVLQIHDDHFAVQILMVPGFDCHLGTDVQKWSRAATPEQKLAAMNPRLRAEAESWLQRRECNTADIAPILDVTTLRDTLVSSLPPDRIGRLFGSPLWGCSRSVLNKSFRFPSVSRHELRAAWYLEADYQAAKESGTVVPGVWTQPRYPYPDAPTHPRQAVAASPTP